MDEKTKNSSATSRPATRDARAEFHKRIEARVGACPRCFGDRYVEKRTHFPGSTYSPAGTLIESVACPRCNVSQKGVGSTTRGGSNG